MKRVLVFAVSMLLASVAFAERPETVLTADGVLYAITADGDLPLLEVTQRSATVSKIMIVPSTEDFAYESCPRIAWDSVTKSLFVVWHRTDVDGDHIRMTTLSADGTWAEPITIAVSPTARQSGLQIALSHVTPQGDAAKTATLLHLVWWTLNESAPTPQYALIGFEGSKYMSTDVSNLQTLTGLRESGAQLGNEDVPSTLHPPLAIANTAAPAEVEVVYGAQGTTALTRVRLTPKLVSNARLWKPSRGGAGMLPRAELTSTNGSPVRSFISNGRVVLYTPEEMFRYTVFDNNAWSPTRMIKLDDKLSSDDLLEELHKAVEEQETSGGNEPSDE